MASPRVRLVVAILLSLILVSSAARKFILVVDDDDDPTKAEETLSSQDDLVQLESPDLSFSDLENEEWDELEDVGNQDVDPGSWKQAYEEGGDDNEAYVESISKLIKSFNNGEVDILADTVKELQALADQGFSHAQSTLASLYSHGYGLQQNDHKAYLFHHFASEGGNQQSKLALAYTYYRQQRYDEAVKLYSELAASAVGSLVTSKDAPVVEYIRLNDGPEENKDALKKYRGEDDDDFQFLEYQAVKGNAQAMYKMGLFYYYGMRGIRRDHAKALSWFGKSVEKGEPASLEFLGEIYARGSGVERNYTKAVEYLKRALREKRYSAFNGLGYLYYIGQGVDKRNFTMAKEYFKNAADKGDPAGYYNLGVLYLKGAGVKKSIKLASKYFVIAANHGNPKAFYQLARMQHRGIGMRKDLATAVELYKLVAERGPWGSLLRWALECYLKGDIGLSLLLYSRSAELGYEIAQSNAGWILQKYQDDAVCIGQSGFCSESERHQRAHALWQYASEQGNEYAALLIGDAYYYGRGTGKDLERAAAAYRLAGEHRNAQAMFNLGYMHEHGLGLPTDFHLAKRYYDQALETDSAALLPVYLALAGLRLRQLDESSALVKFIDSLPMLSGKARVWLHDFNLEDSNVILITLVICLVTVLYLKKRQQQQVPNVNEDVAVQ